jgi:diphosphomevalonate decarboxylase
MFTTNDFIPTYSHNIEGGEFLWTAPSNIALVKYWGKDNQIPANPSVSFTLNNCKP